MSHKKELHKIMGDDNTLRRMTKRVLTTEERVAHREERRHRQTWKPKGQPRSDWYPETPDIHVYGEKK